MLKKISLEKVNYLLKKYRRLIPGIVFILLVGLNIFIYYQYVYLVMVVRPEPKLEKTTIDRENLEKVLDSLDQRQTTLNRVERTGYSDPFQ